MDESEARALLEERTRLRSLRDFAGADAIRARLTEAGWEITDRPEGSSIRRRPPPPPPCRVTYLTLVHGWPEDVRRWLDSVLVHPADSSWEVLIVNNSGSEEVAGWLSSVAGGRVRVVTLAPPQGWAKAANRGVEESAGEFVILFDPGTELTGEVAAPLLAALADDQVVASGGFGLRADKDLFAFTEAAGADAIEEVDALEGYCIAFRRAEFIAAGGFDQRFTFYRIADIDLSFRLRAGGGRVVTVPRLPVQRHVHRLWEATDPDLRERLSRKNYRRFLETWRRPSQT